LREWTLCGRLHKPRRGTPALVTVQRPRARLQFAFTIIYHYLFPQLTIGLTPLIVVFKSLALWTGNPRYNQAARFWARIFAVNFLFGVITGIPMEFLFGTNWARFSKYAGGVIATERCARAHDQRVI